MRRTRRADKPTSWERKKISIESIEKASSRISDIAFRTPLYYSKYLSNLTSSNVHLKLECYQPIRVFKIRGAANKILRLAESSETSSSSVVTFSAGNHGLAVAYVAERLGMKATVVVPVTAVDEKVRAIREYDNVKLIKTGKTIEELKARAEQLVQLDGAIMVHPFADVDVISGQGTIGLEIFEDLSDVDTVLVPIGGGGLIIGIACAIKARKPQCKIIGICAEGAPAVYRSFRENKIISVPASTIADGMGASTTESSNLDLMKRYVDDIVLVNDDEIRGGMRMMIEDLHILAEAAGASPVAAMASQKYQPQKKDENIALVISGGNASMNVLKQIFET
jgi:threonine dehydratase